MERSSRPTVTDVARLAGVSRQTVSRVARGGHLVGEETAARVRAAIDELGYRPNMTARALSVGRTDLLGILTHASTDHGPISALFSIERAAREQGYSVSIAALDGFDVAEVRTAVDRLVQAGAEGVIAVAPWASDYASLEAVVTAVPLVLTDRLPDLAALSASSDDAGASRQAVEHLLGLGHATVWHVSGPMEWIAAKNRARGWREALQAAGSPVPEPLQGDWTTRCGYAAGQQLAARPEVTAVFAANDQMALGVIRALQDAGLDVPGDVSVVGYDDLPESAYYRPALTTISADSARQGRVSVQLLLDLLAGEQGAVAVLIPARLVVRESTGRPPASTEHRAASTAAPVDDHDGDRTAARDHAPPPEETRV